MNERDMEGEKKRKEAVETNIVHSGLYKINKKYNINLG